MSSDNKKLIEHMDRDAQAFGLPTYSELLATLRGAESLIDTLQLNCFDRVDTSKDARRHKITKILEAAA